MQERRKWWKKILLSVHTRGSEREAREKECLSPHKRSYACHKIFYEREREVEEGENVEEGRRERRQGWQEEGDNKLEKWGKEGQVRDSLFWM